MFRRSHLLIVISLALVVVLSACGGTTPAEDPPSAVTTATAMPAPVPASTTSGAPPQVQVSPTVPAVPAPTPITTPTPGATALAPTQAPAPTPTPIAGLNGGTHSTDQVSLSPAADELPTVEVVKILRPSVVQIVTESLSMGFSNQPVPSKGVGTGVILDEEGHILTNNHVIDGSGSITVTLNTGERHDARLIGGDFTTDLAVIQIDAQGLTAARLGVSTELQVGEDVIAIGHALGLEGGPTVSKGVVSAIGRSIDTDAQTTIVDLIQTDASINPGNSGGPLVNNRAEIVGINTAIIEGSQGIGFSINIDDAKEVATQLVLRGYVNRGFLGITPVNLTPGIADQLDLPITEGVILARVIPGTPADASGLKAEDVIVRLGDESIANNGELSKFLIAHLPGETVEVVIYRGSSELTTSITLGERPR